MKAIKKARHRQNYCDEEEEGEGQCFYSKLFHYFLLLLRKFFAVNFKPKVKLQN